MTEKSFAITGCDEVNNRLLFGRSYRTSVALTALGRETGVERGGKGKRVWWREGRRFVVGRAGQGDGSRDSREGKGEKGLGGGKDIDSSSAGQGDGSRDVDLTLFRLRLVE
ncbi:hypothetical protein ACLOJK_029113 [Asimina triloba]